VTTLLAYVFGLLLVGGLLFLVASFAFGRDEEMVPVLPEGTPLELPDDRPADGRDLRDLRLSVVARGYRMDEVDLLLDRLAEQVDARDREIARLRSVLHVEPVAATAEPSAQENEWAPPAESTEVDEREVVVSEPPAGER
jgi:DivIVA domain-containing protein